MARAADILLTGRTFRGEEAFELGIASRVVAAEEVLPVAREIARDIAVNVAPLSVAVCKRLLWESFACSAEEIERHETRLHHHLMGKADVVEGPVAYLERRPPRWTGKVTKDWPDRST
jgi:enoyl-CoA hydratase/carnithine racemase